MRSVNAGVLYFACVFGAGFALGAVRVPFLVPRLGERWAELIEMPVMLVVIVLAARWIVRRLEVPPQPAARLPMGLVALTLLLTAEILLAIVLQGRSWRDYIASRDPVSGSVYLVMLGVYALMPQMLALGITRARAAGTSGANPPR